MTPTEKTSNPGMYGAEPVYGNYTHEAEEHLWCADALSAVLVAPEQPIHLFNEDIKAALRHLLSCEISRARQAQKGEARHRGQNFGDDS